MRKKLKRLKDIGGFILKGHIPLFIKKGDMVKNIPEEFRKPAKTFEKRLKRSSLYEPYTHKIFLERNKEEKFK